MLSCKPSSRRPVVTAMLLTRRDPENDSVPSKQVRGPTGDLECAGRDRGVKRAADAIYRPIGKEMADVEWHPLPPSRRLNRHTDKG